MEITTDLLFTRTQGVQLFRDGMYNACILYMNRVMTKQQTYAFISDLLMESVGLIKLEVENGKVIDGQNGQ